jgi:hypothetical protein
MPYTIAARNAAKQASGEIRFPWFVHKVSKRECGVSRGFGLWDTVLKEKEACASELYAAR